MAIADYRTPRLPRGTDYRVEAVKSFNKKGVKPSDYRQSEDESADSVIGRYNAALSQEAQAIKESRDPKLERNRQLGQRTAAMSKADQALELAGVPAKDRLVGSAQDFWVSEPGLAKTSFTERTGKKVDIPAESQVGALSREVETQDGGMVRQIAGPYGSGSTKLTGEQTAKLAEQRASEEDRALRYQNALASARALGKQKEKERGEEVAAKFAQWEDDKRAYAEGRQIQREATRRIGRINRALREDNRFRQKWERGQGDQMPMSAEAYNSLLDERAALKNTVAQREGLGMSKKKITQIGYDAQARRRQRVAEQALLREAGIKQAEAAAKGAETASKIVPIYSPYMGALGQFVDATFTSGGYLPFTLNPAPLK